MVTSRPEILSTDGFSKKKKWTQKLSITLEILEVGALTATRALWRSVLQGQIGGVASEELAISEAFRSFKGDRSVRETEE